ncbi:hypothetical protein N7447_001220 [Penicillium robsamsonii]|uniref:uncharacterized protein n=1 Tax=Penicillium robsamsonii TaxID=1792511 RepID=UPI0025476043|nr:uncharacterized protein N7447_001220 [Penicillium robsamsonii]KAJ5835194.1 hypothetical protein N7447_001220 [Penicillium robsamsonii]
MIQSHLMWLAHIISAVALTITATAQTTSSPAPLLGCDENLIKDVAFETINLDGSLWTILPPKGGVAVDGYLHLSAEAIQSQTLLTQAITGAVAEEIVDRTACAVNILLNGADFGSSTLTVGSWKTISKQWTPASSEVDMLILIECSGAKISGTTVDLNNISFEKICSSSTSSSASVPTKTPSGSPVVDSTPLASSASSSGHSSSEGSGSSSHISPASPSSTGPITLTITITGPANPTSSGAIASTALTIPTPDMTTSAVFTTRTATITACPSTVIECPATDKTTRITTETILVSITACPVEDATTTTKGPSPTSSSGSGSGNDYIISTILSTRTVALTQCPATVTGCPARDQTTHVTIETVVTGTTAVPINTALSTTTPGAAHTSFIIAGTGTTFTEGDVSTGNDAGHLSNLPSITRTCVHSATAKASSITASSPTSAGAGAGSGSTTDSSSPASTSPVFNGASSFIVSGAVSALGVIAALALFP